MTATNQSLPTQPDPTLVERVAQIIEESLTDEGGLALDAREKSHAVIAVVTDAFSKQGWQEPLRNHDPRCIRFRSNEFREFCDCETLSWLDAIKAAGQRGYELGLQDSYSRIHAALEEVLAEHDGDLVYNHAFVPADRIRTAFDNLAPQDESDTWLPNGRGLEPRQDGPDKPSPRDKFAHPMLTHRNGEQCIWISGTGWFVPLDAGGEGYSCPHDHPPPQVEHDQQIAKRTLLNAERRMFATTDGDLVDDSVHDDIRPIVTKPKPEPEPLVRTGRPRQQLDSDALFADILDQ